MKNALERIIRKLFSRLCCECGEVRVLFARRCSFCDDGEGPVK